jgi:WD40 repeat protein
MAVAISPDGKTIVSGSVDDTVRLWDIASERCIQPLAFKPPAPKPHSLSRERSKYEKYLRASVRCLSLNSSTPGACLDQGLGDLVADDEWVTRDGQKLIWLPPNFRECWDSFDTMLVIGNSDGRVTTLDLD